MPSTRLDTCAAVMVALARRVPELITGAVTVPPALRAPLPAPDVIVMPSIRPLVEIARFPLAVPEARMVPELVMLPVKVPPDPAAIADPPPLRTAIVTP